MDREHLVVQFLRGLRSCCDPVEVANVLACFLNDGRRIRAAWPLVSRNNGARLQRFDHVERSDPLFPRIGSRLAKVDVNIVIGDVARYDQADRRDMKASRISSISMPRWDAH